MTISVLALYYAMIAEDPNEFRAQWAGGTAPNDGELGPDLPEWEAMMITTPMGREAAGFIVDAARLIDWLNPASGSDVDFKAVRYALVAAVDQCVHGGP